MTENNKKTETEVIRLMILILGFIVLATTWTILTIYLVFSPELEGIIAATVAVTGGVFWLITFGIGIEEYVHATG